MMNGLGLEQLRAVLQRPLAQPDVVHGGVGDVGADGFEVWPGPLGKEVAVQGGSDGS